MAKDNLFALLGSMKNAHKIKQIIDVDKRVKKLYSIEHISHRYSMISMFQIIRWLI
jgi:hypothetical protein